MTVVYDNCLSLKEIESLKVIHCLLFYSAGRDIGWNETVHITKNAFLLFKTVEFNKD